MKPLKTLMQGIENSNSIQLSHLEDYDVNKRSDPLYCCSLEPIMNTEI